MLSEPLPVGSWYAVLTRSRHERKVHDQLQQKGLEAFLPTTFRWSKWRDRRKRIDWPLFPGYCFVRLFGGSLLPVLSCAGVSQIVSVSGHPASIPDHEIEAIRRLMETTMQFDTWPFLAEGALVQVTRGPLTGVRGRFIRRGTESRLVLAVEMLGRAVSVQIDGSDVERV